MAGIDALRVNYYFQKMELIKWCIVYKPSLLANITLPFEGMEHFMRCKQNFAKARGIELIPENEEEIDNIKLEIARFKTKQDRYLYWHCPLDFVREYLETQCGYKKANWFVKLFWQKMY